MNTKNKTEFFIFRTSSEEKNELKQLLKAHGFNSISHFFRIQIGLLKEKPKPKKVKSRNQIIEETAELLNAQIAKIGVNINQFMRKANSVHGNSDLAVLGKSILQQQNDIADLLQITIEHFKKLTS